MTNFFKMNVAFALLIMLLILTSCNETEKENSKEKGNSLNSEVFYTFENPETKQKFKIIQVAPLIKEYIEKVQGNQEEAQKLYNDIVVDPIYKDCFENAEYQHLVRSFIDSPPENLNDLEVIVDNIEEQKETTNEYIEEALLRSADLLPSQKEVAVCVMPYNNDGIFMGITAGSGKIIIPYDSEYDGISLKTNVAHEYQHSYWVEKHLSDNREMTVLDNIVYEGKGIMFSIKAYPEFYSSQIESAYNKELWAKLEPYLDKVDIEFLQKVTLGDEEFPQGHGYFEGFQMVKEYLELYPDTSPEEWTALSAKEILEKSHYADNYK